MSADTIRLRIATPDDAGELVRIYAPYVEKTAISFEYDVPSLADFRGRIEATLQRYPYIVAVENASIVGYAYTSAFHSRAAYARSAETSIYVREDTRGAGVGRRLYEAIERVSKAQNVLNLNACIGYAEEEDEYLNRNSVRFHARMGYSMAGITHQCGFKFGRWYGIAWMEKMIGAHSAQPAAFLPFPELPAETVLNLLQ